MDETLPPDLREKVAKLAAELDVTIEEFIVQTVAERVEIAEFFKSRVGTSKPGDLTKLLMSAPNRPPFPGDEIPPDVAERIAARRSTRAGED